MATATVHIESVGGYAGPSRCFAIDPPFEGYSFVTVCATPGFGGVVRPKADVFPADETGACADPSRSLIARPGSFILHDEPTDPDKIDGAYWLALQLLGGYEITQPAPQDA